ncbi:polysaccharide pyruvyl transferase family protein [Acidipropionibacterium jensenii]|uniref:polysaccharide pyruvyl transferase family protein n=1 Tax=Acidipropionibacterium jensenii TaxID=1749 RepID=UPI000490CAAB|nr:polysaccharide pyruvyl transferase family protein [Acidipropionibacterium jensenii]
MTDDRTSPTAGLITLHRVPNYGSVLQAYATQQLLKRNGFQPTVLDYWRPDQVPGARREGIHTRLGGTPLGRAVYRVTQRDYVERSLERFGQFVDANLCVSSACTSVDDMSALPGQDLYVVGSDQVWNRRLNVGGTDPYVLSYLPSSAPKIALSASIGRSRFTSEDTDYFRKHLRSFRWISVRESSAQQLLKSINITSTVVPDPTLLTQRSTWDDLAEPLDVDGPYLLIYCLHGSKAVRRLADRLASDLGLTVVNLVSYWRSPLKHPGDLRLPTVPQFLGAVRGASHVITDSFHGTCFSMNFGVPVSVVTEPPHGVRLVDFLELVGCGDRLHGSANYSPQVSEAYLSAMGDRVAELRSEGLQTLDEALSSGQAGN